MEVEVQTVHLRQAKFRSPFQPAAVRRVKTRRGKLKEINIEPFADTRFYWAESQLLLSIDGHLVNQLTSLQADTSSVERDYVRLVKHLELRLELELARAVSNLFLQIERTAGLSREELISVALAVEEKHLRKHLPQDLDRVLRRRAEEEEWTELAIDAVYRMLRAREKVTKTNLAKRLFPRNSNQLQELRRHVPLSIQNLCDAAQRRLDSKH